MQALGEIITSIVKQAEHVQALKDSCKRMAMIYQHDDKVFLETFLELPYMALDLPYAQWCDVRDTFMVYAEAQARGMDAAELIRLRNRTHEEKMDDMVEVMRADKKRRRGHGKK